MEHRKLPIYKLIIDDNDASGVDFVALVDEPATGQHWHAFAKQYQFKVISKEQRIISGPLLIAGTPIYRRDEKMGEHYVFFDPESIRKIVLKFFRNGYSNQVNLMHEPATKGAVKGVYLFESFILDKQRGINPPKGFEDLPDGSWFASYKVDNDGLWNDLVKSGRFRGFSVEGFFAYQAANAGYEEQLLRAIIDVVQQVKG